MFELGLNFYLDQPFAQHALIAGALVALTCGLIGPFVVTRGMAFAVHGTSELAFTGAAAGLLIANNAVAGALVGALVFATIIGLLGVRERERDSAIGVILAFPPAAGPLRVSSNPLTATALAIVFAFIAADGGILASLPSTTVKPSVFVTSFSFAIYLGCRLFAFLRARA